MANKTTDVFRYIAIRTQDECWEWQGEFNERSTTPLFNCKGKKLIAYRVVYELAHGVTLTKEQIIRHKCDNRKCCNPQHLELGTHQENMDDMKERDRHGLSKHVRANMVRLWERGKTHDEIASLYGCGRSTVTEAIKREISNAKPNK